MNDPFASVLNEAPHTALELRTALLADARRGYAPLRKVFVQQPQESASRPSILGDMVRTRQETPLRLWLLVLALEPLVDLQLPPARWAGMVSAAGRPCSPSQIRAAIEQLERRKLIERTGTPRMIGLRPLFEDGSGNPYTRPTAKGAEVGKGYFVVPHDAWDTELLDRLRLPGLAAFLVSLHDTHQTPAFQVTLERMPEWYGISERTAERGYRELLDQGVLLTHPQTVRDRRAPKGIRTVTWRALEGPYSMHAREALQAATRTRARRSAKAAKKAAK